MTPSILRLATLLALGLGSLSACSRTEVNPITVLGEWRLTISGGGITGKMDVLPPSVNSRLVFGPDSAYARYYNGRLQESSTFHVRTVKRDPASPEERVIFMKSFSSPNGQPYYQREYITTLTATRMELSTGTGCAINGVYERVSPVSNQLPGKP